MGFFMEAVRLHLVNCAEQGFLPMPFTGTRHMCLKKLFFIAAAVRMHMIFQCASTAFCLSAGISRSAIDKSDILYYNKIDEGVASSFEQQVNILAFRSGLF